MKPEYEPRGTTAHLGYLVEEAGEVLAAAGKTLRWGLASVNPDLPSTQQETNQSWLEREMNDLEGAIWKMRRHLAGERP